MTAAWEQPSLFAGEPPQVGYPRPVFAIDPSQFTNGQRVADLARLGYLPEPVLDPTYGYGSMWEEYRPEHLTCVDLNPERGVQVEDFRHLPFGDNHFASCLFDPPYKFAGTPTTTHAGGHDDLYGITHWRSPAELMRLQRDGAVECARVTSDFLIVKCMDQVVSDRVGWQTHTMTALMEGIGWHLNDSLLLMSYRAQDPARGQKHARRNYSTFLVFRPGPPPVSTRRPSDTVES